MTDDNNASQTNTDGEDGEQFGETLVGGGCVSTQPPSLVGYTMLAVNVGPV